jgi:hypothetical protein
MRGHYGEARGWITRLLALAQGGDRTEAHASAFHAIGALTYLQGDYSTAETRHREALDIWRRWATAEESDARSTAWGESPVHAASCRLLASSTKRLWRLRARSAIDAAFR